MSFLNGLPVQGHNRSLPSRPMGLWKGSAFLLSRGEFWTQVFLAQNYPLLAFQRHSKMHWSLSDLLPLSLRPGRVSSPIQFYISIVFRRRMFLALCTRIRNLFNIFMETYLKISCSESMTLNCSPLHFFLSWSCLILKVLVGRPKKEKKSTQRGGGASFILVRCVLFSSIECHLQSPGKNQIVPQDFLFAEEKRCLRHSRLPSLGLWEAVHLAERPRKSQPRRHFWRVWGPQGAGSSPCSPWQVAPSCFQTAATATQLHLSWMDDELLNVCAAMY